MRPSSLVALLLAAAACTVSEKGINSVRELAHCALRARVGVPVIAAVGWAFSRCVAALCAIPRVQRAQTRK